MQDRSDYGHFADNVVSAAGSTGRDAEPVVVDGLVGIDNYIVALTFRDVSFRSR